MSRLIVPDRSYPMAPGSGEFSDARFDGGRYDDQKPQDGPAFGGVFGALWRQRLIFVVLFAATLGGAVVAILHLQPSYRSEALLLIDFRQPNISDLQSGRQSAMGMADLNTVNSEMQILQSDQLARKVITSLNLQSDSEFADKPSALSALLAASPAARLIDFVRSELGWDAGPPPPKTGEQRMQEAIANYKQRFSSYTDGKSFVISAWFNASNPNLAQTILTKHLSIYLADQTVAKQDVISKADRWFTTELKALSERLQQAEQGQQAFRDSNHLLLSNGQTVAGRQLAEVTGQLAAARADLARKEARYQEINGLGGTASPGGVTDTTVLSSQLVQRLREQEATASQQVAQLQGRFGSQHPQLIAAKAALADVQQKITREIDRMTASAANDVAIARANTQQLEQSVAKLEQQLGLTDKSELTATQLARKTDADRRLYDDLLMRSKQITIRKETQEPDARIVSDASLPLSPAFPRHFILYTIAFTAAAVFAGAIGIMIDKLRTGPSQSLDEIENACAVAGLAVLPKVRASRRGRRLALTPASLMAASLQTLQNSVAFRCLGQASKVIAVTSALPRDGKSTVALLYARSLVLVGKKVLLIDADLRRRGLTRLFHIVPMQGIVCQLQQPHPLESSIATDHKLGLDVLAVEHISRNPGRLLTRDRIERLLNAARASYDVIVIDTPPLAAVDDALSVASLADATLVVVRWGRTPHYAIRAAAQRLRDAGAHVVGVVLNATDTRKHRSGARDLEAYRPLSGQYFSGQL